MSNNKSIDITTPEKLRPLWTPSRYKILHGGRGGAKSWNIARTLLAKGVKESLRILCAREFQNSIKESVYQLLVDQIKTLGLSEHYNCTKTEIVGNNGTKFSFVGLKFNVHKMKSFEGVDIAWIEEASVVSKASWTLLIPTIRKDKSEIWISFNPELATDYTYEHFVLNPPRDSIVININWRDNPWFPDVLHEEMLDCKERDEEGYLNIWEGECRASVEGAVYAREMAKIEADKRICPVPLEMLHPVNTFWDLGWRDQTAIWFIQKRGFHYAVVDFYQDAFKDIPFYINMLQNKGYIYGTDYLPHDGGSKFLAVGSSVEDIMRKAGRNVRVVPRSSVYEGIQASRLLMAQCYFDAEKTFDGLLCL